MTNSPPRLAVHRALVGVLLTVAPVASQAGTDWTLMAPQVSPPYRFGAALAFDARTGETLLVGGQAPGGIYHKDTWAWNGKEWRQQVLQHQPEPRSFTAMAYDARRGVVVLFGGRNRTQSFGDTWEYDGIDWTQRTTLHAPPPDTGHSMTYDSLRGRCVMFPGASGSLDTWEYDGTDWYQITPSHSPSPRQRAGMAFHAALGVSVLFGGRTDLADTWAWDGTDWTQLQPATSPLGRSEFAITYDAARQRIVINAGVNSASSPIQLDDTWEFDGTTWMQRQPTSVPPLRDGHALAFDSWRNQVVLFGHGTDTWQYAPLDPATVEPFGAGCTGTHGVPSLAAASGGLPWIGEHLVLAVDHVSTSPLWTLALGTSNATWNGVPLPFDLGQLGMTGCTLRVSPDLLVNGAGTTASFTIPAQPSLVGSGFFAQMLVADASANAAGLIVSNAVACRIGTK